MTAGTGPQTRTGVDTRTGATRYDRDDDRDGDRERAPVKMITSTETRRSLSTSEFWLTLAAAIAVIIAGYWDEANLRVDLAWALGMGVIAAYVLSRGFAKAGSRDPDIRNVR